jgi:hypothetical protein
MKGTVMSKMKIIERLEQLEDYFFMEREDNLTEKQFREEYLRNFNDFDVIVQQLKLDPNSHKQFIPNPNNLVRGAKHE